MIFKIKIENNKPLERAYKKAMTDLKKFYGLNWIYNTPKIIVVDDRKTIDKLRGAVTEPWVCGWIDGNNVFVLNNEHMEKESCHKKYSDKEYAALIKHELSHAFCNIVSGHAKTNCKWLWEGLATYTSGQNEFKKPLKKFKNFLSFYENGGSSVYYESGFAIETLVRKFGKNKLLKLIKSLKNIKDRKEFDDRFKFVYGFKPSYDKFNNLLNK